MDPTDETQVSVSVSSRPVAETPTREEVVATWQHANVAKSRYEAVRAAFVAAAAEYRDWYDRFTGHTDAADPADVAGLEPLPAPKLVTAAEITPATTTTTTTMPGPTTTTSTTTPGPTTTTTTTTPAPVSAASR